jgi:hypothetical protein
MKGAGPTWQCGPNKDSFRPRLVGVTKVIRAAMQAGLTKVSWRCRPLPLG